MIVLDTDVLIEIFDKHSEKGEQVFKMILDRGDSIATTAINLHEVIYGLEKYAKQVSDILQLPTLSYTKDDSRLSVKLEISVEKSGKPVRRTDTMIAAIAIRNDADLLTFDSKHFSPMKPLGLKLLQPNPAR